MQILCDSCIVGGAVCIIVCSYIQHFVRLIHMLTLLLWQYRAYVMDSVSSDQAIITSHHHSFMHTLCTTPSQSCLLPIPLFNS